MRHAILVAALACVMVGCASTPEHPALRVPAGSAAAALGLSYWVGPVEITHAPDGDFGSDLVESNVCYESQFCDVTGKLLRRLPAAGSKEIPFPKDEPQWRVRVSDHEGTYATLLIVGDRLCAPDTSKGRFFDPQPAAEEQFVNHMKSLTTFRNTGDSEPDN
jgi:hypothetical protein